MSRRCCVRPHVSRLDEGHVAPIDTTPAEVHVHLAVAGQSHQAGRQAELEGGAGRLFLRGTWVNFSNPKTIPFFLVIIQAASVPTDGFAWSTTGVFLLCTLGAEVGVMSFYAFLGDRLRVRLKDAATIRWVDRALGVLWTALGLLMAWRVWQLLEGSH